MKKRGQGMTFKSLEDVDKALAQTATTVLSKPFKLSKQQKQILSTTFIFQLANGPNYAGPTQEDIHLHRTGPFSKKEITNAIRPLVKNRILIEERDEQDGRKKHYKIAWLKGKLEENRTQRIKYYKKKLEQAENEREEAEKKLKELKKSKRLL